MGHASYYSLQNLLSFHLLHKNVKIKIYRTKIVPATLYEHETWDMTDMRLSENRVLRRIYGT
jgi:hypothetical protein